MNNKFVTANRSSSNLHLNE